MKKLIVCVSVLLICVTAICAFVACNEREPDLTGLNMAKDYLSAQLKDAPVDTNADFERPTALRNEHGSYTVAWTISVTSGDANGVKLGAEGTGVITIDVDEMTTADIVYTLTATISDAEGNTVTLTFNHKVPKLNKVTVAELLAKEVGDTVYAVEGYVMASAANPGKTGSFVIADATGAIFSYNKFELNVGDKVLAFGTRSVNASLPQLGTTAVKVLEADSEGYAEATATELAAEDINLSNLKEADMPVMAGTYYKITGVTLVKSEGYTNADYNGKQLLQLYTNDAMCDAAADLYGETVNIYGYVRGFKNGSYLTVQVSKIEYGGEGEFVPKTPAERVAHEKDALALDIITAAGEITLPAIGERFSNVEITWTLAETTVATLANGKLTVAALPAVRTEITLTATLKCGEATDTKTITAIVREPWGELTNKVQGATLLSYTELGTKANDTNKYYTIGWVSKIENTKYGNLYIKNAEGKEFYVYGVYDCNGKVRFDSLETKPIIGDVVVLYGEVTTYKDVPQLKNACMMQLNGTVFTPAAPEEPEEPSTPSTPVSCPLVVGTGYTISAANANGTIYFDGTVSSGRFNGTLTAADAAIVYVEAAANAGEFYLYMTDGTTKTYICIADSSTGGSLNTDKASATVFEWSADKATLAVADDANNRAFGASATSTYNNFSCYDLTGSYNWGIFTDTEGNVITPDVGEEDEEENNAATSLVVGTGYTISAANANGTIYFDGTVSSGRFNGTLTAADAAIVYVEAAANAGEFYLYMTDGTTKTYICIADSSTGGSLNTDKASATVFEWSADKATLAVADDANNRAFGASATSTYNNFSCYDLTGSYNWGKFTAVEA